MDMDINKTTNQNQSNDFFENIDTIVQEDILKLKQCLDRVPIQRNQITTLLVETSSLINPESFQILMSLTQDMNIAKYLGEDENTSADGQGTDNHTKCNLSLTTNENGSA